MIFWSVGLDIRDIDMLQRELILITSFYFRYKLVDQESRLISGITRALL